MQNKPNPKASMPLQFFPHYASFMESMQGALYLAHIMELHRTKANLNQVSWDGWFYVDHDLLDKRLYRCSMASILLFERKLRRSNLLEINEIKGRGLKYYRLNLEKLGECLVDALDVRQELLS